MTFGSLFCGIGGFDLGFERMGLQCVWQVERDRQCLELLAQKWPNVRRVNDVVRARYATEPKYAGRMDTAALVRPDIICGGFPCQDLSVAGKRRGLAGGRSGLFWTMRRIIGLLKPTWIVLENVPGLLSSNERRDMGAVVGGLVDSGYGVAWRVLDSQFFGLAQRRKRVFIVGHLGDVRRAGAVLFDVESMSRNSPPSREARESVAYATSPSLRASGVGIEAAGDTRGQDCVVAFAQNTRDEVLEIGGNIAGALPAQPGMKQQTYVAIDYANGTFAESDHAMPLTRSPDRSRAAPVVAMTLNAKNGKRYDAEPETFVTHTLRGEGHDASEDGSGMGVPLVPFAFQPRFARNGRGGPSDVVDALTASESGTHGDSKPHVAYAIQERAVSENPTNGPQGKGYQEGIAFTLEARSKVQASATQHGVRRLMPVECERLQGFPDGWTAGFSDSARYRMLGNAVSVPVIEWIAKRIKEQP